jgi:hypothetical protein
VLNHRAEAAIRGESTGTEVNNAEEAGEALKDAPTPPAGAVPAAAAPPAEAAAANAPAAARAEAAPATPTH